jgi:hypothetical protein
MRRAKPTPYPCEAKRCTRPAWEGGRYCARHRPATTPLCQVRGCPHPHTGDWRTLCEDHGKELLQDRRSLFDWLRLRAEGTARFTPCDCRGCRHEH